MVTRIGMDGGGCGCGGITVRDGTLTKDCCGAYGYMTLGGSGGIGVAAGATALAVPRRAGREDSTKDAEPCSGGEGAARAGDTARTGSGSGNVFNPASPIGRSVPVAC